MRASFVIALVGAAALMSQAALAANAGSVSTKEYLDAIKGACPQTYEKDADGVAQPVVKCSRGFSLATGGPAAGAAARPTGSHHASAVRPAALVHAPASRLSNLLITFKLGSADLDGRGKENADHFAAALKDPSVAGSRFEISGHTDATGATARNQALSNDRAAAVRSYLISQGVDGGRLEAKGYGSNDLADPSHPDSGANRRVEARPLG
jgi:outer membrane protein OmpA-like peptidoglycan-associated protein